MGEWSKRLGDTGEDIVANLLRMIGWTNVKRNIDIPCINKEIHHRARQHGVDGAFSYKSPLENRCVNNVIISVKHTSGEYPASPRREFKEFVETLAATTQCYHKSEEKHRTNKSMSGVDRAQTYGVLFWISKKASPQATIIDAVWNSRFNTETHDHPVLFVDNKVASFLFDSIIAIERRFDSHPNFFYCNTGMNYDQTSRESFGSVLPVELINAPVIPFVASHASEKTFIVSTKENFSSERLMRLIGLSKELSQDLTSKVLLLFPDYDPDLHESITVDAKTGVDDDTFANSIEVGSYRSDFRNER